MRPTHFTKKESCCGNSVDYSVELRETHGGHAKEKLFTRNIKNKIDYSYPVKLRAKP